MPLRIRAPLQANQLRPAAPRMQYVCWQCRHASVATATTPAPPIDQTIHAAPSVARYPATQPPSYKPPEFRKSQLHRQYQSVLRSSPLMLIFQHNNLKSTEWAGIRRELAVAMDKVDEELAKNGNVDYLGRNSRISVVQTGIFASALQVVEFWSPKFETETQNQHPTDRQTATSSDMKKLQPEALLTHGLSKKAHTAVKKRKHARHGLEPLLSGPLAILTLPSVSPQHLKAAISILSPSKEFPAPKRKANPSYHEPAVQNGLQKLMLLGARVEGKAFDTEGAKWVGSIAGGLEGLRGQLVAMLSGVGAGITTTLETASKSLYLTVESRRTMLEEEGKPTEESS
ncbi:hypothetical protein DOTSEDRAFT_68855 [Dothistroma septosporum NZE10]|uniref:Uncharacterized protein n=1 Tax=Dothistroma septosporum (strain NZE10 / CBS 128990) TaxID=675120 RepID=N1Q5B2_DOTSN|nr:hypothetical protein DOTSEDRAFT_68855 [Dothistroma septosporum NZE10]